MLNAHKAWRDTSHAVQIRANIDAFRRGERIWTAIFGVAISVCFAIVALA